MSRWVDVRILNGEAGRAVTLLGAALGPVNMRINTDPPSAAPGVEWELSIEGHGEAGITDLLRGWGITVLAVRERLDAPLTIAEARR
jgi:hypothetical protein